LGEEFLSELEFFYESLQKNPNTCSYFEKPVREGKIKRFPYLVIYEFFSDTNTIVFYSLFMSMQNPKKKRTL
jgi:hypothetical protein